MSYFENRCVISIVCRGSVSIRQCSDDLSLLENNGVCVKRYKRFIATIYCEYITSLLFITLITASWLQWWHYNMESFSSCTDRMHYISLYTYTINTTLTSLNNINTTIKSLDFRSWAHTPGINPDTQATLMWRWNGWSQSVRGLQKLYLIRIFLSMLAGVHQPCWLSMHVLQLLRGDS